MSNPGVSQQGNLSLWRLRSGSHRGRRGGFTHFL